MGHAFWDAVFGAHQHTSDLIQPFINTVLSRNLYQTMPKNAYFWKKAVKLSQRWGTLPPTLVGLRQ